jgi:glucose/arabinose dehydrogenase
MGLEPVTTEVASPTAFEVPPTDGDSKYVAELPGRIRMIEGDDLRQEPFLDIADRVITGSERGLLGVAFHPEYAENGRFFVRYSAAARAGTPAGWSHTFVVAEFQADGDGTTADPDSERTVIEIPEPQGNHNAGDLAFGPDGKLYVPVGDGGGAGDGFGGAAGHPDDWYDAVVGGNGQDVEANLLGSMLRLDVDATPTEHPRTDPDAPDSPSGDGGYAIPDDNPLVSEPGRDEHYAWGLRNPWRISFDGDRLFVGDVGQNEYEEVNIVEKGGNYGWNVREGRHCFDAATCPDETPDDVRGGEPLRDPILEYTRPEQTQGESGVAGRSVTGGFVYRGDRLDSLTGRYVFGDLYRNDVLFVGTETDDGWTLKDRPIREADRVDGAALWSFGTDRAGELYTLWGRRDGSGAVYRVVSGDGGESTTDQSTDPRDTDGSGDGTGASAPGFGALAAVAGVSGALGAVRLLWD